MLKKSQAKFVYYFIVTFVVLFVMLYALGLVPDSIKSNGGDTLRTLWDKAQSEAVNKQTGQGTAVGQNPIRIVIDKIGVDAVVSNPNTTDATTLDEYLLQGAVRYPGSGLLGSGNMLIFGHSTGFAVVHNQAYKTFNDLGKLKVGDEIVVYSSDSIYTYNVTSVVMKPASQVEINLSGTKNMLTLTTCNVFGAKEDRYVVEADYTGKM
jgi:LPXTG-site transpeptidase (sortase) family protein